MTSRQRVKQALRHQATDFIPFEFNFSILLAERIKREYGIADLPQKMGVDVVCAGYRDAGEWIKPGFHRDGFGVVWNQSGADKDIGVIDNLVIPEPDIGLIHLPAVDTARAHAFFKEQKERAGDRFCFAEIGFSLFERAWTLCGMENLLVYMALEPQFTHTLMEKIADRNLQIMDIALEYGFDGFHFGDDWGQQKGLIMGPKHWHSYLKPHLAAMYGKAKSAGLPVSQHSCGDIGELFGTLIDIGLDCYQTFQPEIYPEVEFKRQWGDKLSVWGGISTQRLLPFATPNAVRARTAEIMRNVGQKSGGMIAAPTHSLTPDIPPENVFAMLDVMTNQQKFL